MEGAIQATNTAISELQTGCTQLQARCGDIEAAVVNNTNNADKTAEELDRRVNLAGKEATKHHEPFAASEATAGQGLKAIEARLIALESAFGTQNVSSEIATLQAKNVDLDTTDLEHNRDIKELQRKLHEAYVNVTDEFIKLRVEIGQTRATAPKSSSGGSPSQHATADTDKRFESVDKISGN